MAARSQLWLYHNLLNRSSKAVHVSCFQFFAISNTTVKTNSICMTLLSLTGERWCLRVVLLCVILVTEVEIFPYVSGFFVFLFFWAESAQNQIFSIRVLVLPVSRSTLYNPEISHL